MIDIINLDSILPDGIFYKHNILKFGYTLNVGDFVRYHFEHNYTPAITYENDTYVFLAVSEPNGIPGFIINIADTLRKIPDSEKLNIVISYPMETFMDNNVEMLVRVILENYNKANIFFSYGNANTDPTHIQKVLSKRVKYISNPLFEMHYGDHIRNSGLTNYEQKPLTKKFLIPIRQAKPFRLFFYMWARDNNILENSYYSWTTENVYNAMSVYRGTYSFLFKKEMTSEDVEFLKNPVIFDIDDDRPVQKKQWDMTNVVADSFMQVVCETTFHEGLEKNNHTIFLTEKTYKPIFYKQPFILMSEPYSLQYLRDMGYKTFSSFIDESYDLIEDSKLRMESICKEISKINSMSLEQLEQIRIEIQDIVEHNYRVFMSKPSEQVLIKHIKEILFNGKEVNQQNIG